MSSPLELQNHKKKINSEFDLFFNREKTASDLTTLTTIEP